MKGFFKGSLLTKEKKLYISFCFCKFYDKLIGFHYGKQFFDINSLFICLPKPLRY